MDWAPLVTGPVVELHPLAAPVKLQKTGPDGGIELTPETVAVYVIIWPVVPFDWTPETEIVGVT